MTLLITMVTVKLNNLKSSVDAGHVLTIILQYFEGALIKQIVIVQNGTSMGAVKMPSIRYYLLVKTCYAATKMPTNRLRYYNCYELNHFKLRPKCCQTVFPATVI